MKRLAQIYILLSIGLSLLVLSPAAQAQLQPEQVDTLYHAQVAPGMYHTEYEIRSVPWRIQVLRIDQTAQDTEFRTVKANNRLTGLQRPMDMKAELENDSVYVVAGINGDFYGTGGVPVNSQVANGVLLKRPYPRELIAFDEEFQPFIQTTSFSGSVLFDGNEQAIDGINEGRGENHLTIYNSYFGNSTGTNAFGTEVGVRLIDAPMVNRSVRVVVEALESQQGDMVIHPHDMTLSGHGTASDFLETLSVDDTLDVRLNLNPLERPILEAIGGSTQFIKNGVVNSNWEERHPRTAVGFSADTSNAYFVVVDGRQSRSAGMMLSELGDFMVMIGIDHAINLDGGGSSAMIIQDDVVNNPSDGGLQRAVANGLFVTMENPGMGETQGIQIRPGYQTVFLGRHVDLSVNTYDENFRRVQISNDEIEYSVTSSLGSISESGRFTAGYETGSGFIYAEYDGFIDSTRIEVVGVGELRLSPSEITIDTTMEFSPMVSIRDMDGLPQSLERGQISWSITDPSVGTIDTGGNFLPSATGITGVVGSVGEVADTAWVTVQQDEGVTELTSFSDPEFWDITTENLDEENVSLEMSDDGGLELQFTYPSGGDQAQIILNGSIQISGVPKFAHIETSGDGKDYILYVDIENPEDGRYRMGPQRLANHTQPEVLEFIFEQSWANRITPGASYYFPFSIEAFILQLPDNNTGNEISGSFTFYSASAVYSDTPVSIDEDPVPETANEIKLHQNYPNPFNPVTTISYELPAATDVRLEIFDLLGRRVALLVDGRVSGGYHDVTFDASSLSSGIYLYQLQTGSATLSNQMMLIK